MYLKNKKKRNKTKYKLTYGKNNILYIIYLSIYVYIYYSTLDVYVPTSSP